MTKPHTGHRPPELLDVRRIWDAAPHNAFTDIIRFQDRWYCTFREGQDHVSPDGKLRVITSRDGQQWESAVLIASAHEDLRDAKLSITPDNKLMLCGAGALHQKEPISHQSYVWTSPDGTNWSEAIPVADPNYWLWRITWHKGRAYGVGYGCLPTNERTCHLYSSRDSRQFDKLVPDLFKQGYPNETSLIFDVDDTGWCLLRRDNEPSSAQLGMAKPPYTNWRWQDLGVFFGGPHMLRLPDGRIVAAGRLSDGQVRTALCWLDTDRSTLEEFLTLPSGGDTSYAGLVWHDDLLWVSYYSSHEEKTSIYLAKVAL